MHVANGQNGQTQPISLGVLQILILRKCSLSALQLVTPQNRGPSPKSTALEGFGDPTRRQPRRKGDRSNGQNGQMTAPVALPVQIRILRKCTTQPLGVANAQYAQTQPLSLGISDHTNSGVLLQIGCAGMGLGAHTSLSPVVIALTPQIWVSWTTSTAVTGLFEPTIAQNEGARNSGVVIQISCAGRV